MLAATPYQKNLGFEARLVNCLETQSVAEAGHRGGENRGGQALARPEDSAARVITDAKNIRLKVFGAESVANQLFIAAI